MKAVVKSNDLVGAITVQAAPFARQFDCAFVGLGATVGKKDAVETRYRRQPRGQLYGRLVIECRRWAYQVRRLSAHGVPTGRGPMPQAVHGPALHEIPGN